MKNTQPSLKKFSLKIYRSLFGFGTNPETDWKIIFVSTVVLIVGVITLSVFVFIKSDKRESLVTNNNDVQSEAQLDTELLRETILYYQDKKVEFERLDGVVAPMTDPSL